MGVRFGYILRARSSAKAFRFSSRENGLLQRWRRLISLAWRSTSTRACVVRTEERFSLQNQDLRNGIGQSVRRLLNREMGFIRPGYRWGAERYLWDPYQLLATVPSSHRGRLLHLCVCRLQMYWHQIWNWLFCFTNINKCIPKYYHSKQLSLDYI